MQTLILSCNTGAGHNSCAQAVQEAYHSRGEICNITDSLQFISEKASTFISNWHTRIYRHAPRLFDAGYQRAESHEDIFCEGTPIYKLLSSGAERMYQYIRSAGYLFFPTCQNLRPEAFVRNNLLTRFIELFYSFDTNTNVCPSLHVIGSVAAMFGLWDCKALQSVGWKIAATSIAVCISLSTVFMKQHSIMDVLAALPVCFFGWWIAYKILPNNKTNRFLTRM